MQTLMAYTGNNLLDMTFRLTHANAPQLFMRRGRSSTITYAFTITQPPTAVLRLPTTAQPHNLTLDMPNVDISVQPAGGNSVALSCPATARGNLRIAGGMLTVTGLSVTLSNTGILSAVVQQAINTHVLPGIQAALLGVRLPQLNDALNDDMVPVVREGEVIAGPVLRIGAGLSGRTGLANATDLPAADRAQLNNGSASDARLAIMASDDAITVLMREEVGTIARTFNRDLANAAAIRTRFRADRLSLNIANGNGTASMRVRLTLSAGLNIPLVGWRWAAINVPDLIVAVQNSVGAQGASAFVRVGNIASINVVLNLPGWLGPVGTVIRNGVNAVAGLFAGAVNGIINGMRFPVASLPDVIPGTNIPARLSFVPNSVRYVGNALRAIVRVRA